MFLVPATVSSESWTQGRKAAKKAAKAKCGANMVKEGNPPRGDDARSKKVPITNAAIRRENSSKKGQKQKKTKIRVPSRAAVVLTAVDSSKTPLSEALAQVRNKIDLRSLRIASLRPRRAITGTIIYKVPGEQSEEKADALAAKFRQELNSEVVKVARPTKTA